MESDSSADESDSETDYFSDSDDSEDEIEDEGNVEYNPEGIDSDDDAEGCCHWSTTKDENFDDDILSPDDNLSEFGYPAMEFEQDMKPSDIIERIMDEEFILTCIDATNEHGQGDPNFLSRIGNISRDEKGIWFIRGFFAVRWHLKLLKLPQMKWAWSEDALKSQPEVKKTMTLEVFRLMIKHFRVVRQSILPSKASPDYHPLQNITSGAMYLRDKARSFWSFGWKLCIDEGRVRSKSKRNAYKTRNPDKPIRMGWTVCKITDRGRQGGNFIYNHVVKVGKKTYRNTGKGKNYDIVEQLLGDLKKSGRLAVMDSCFPTLRLLGDARTQWRTKIIATQRGNTAHLPLSHKNNVGTSKGFARGFSKTLHHESFTITYWNDNNNVTFLDNGVKSGREHWSTIEVNHGAEQHAIHLQKVAELYWEIYGWVDRCNQQLSYYSTEFRSVLKQSRVFDNLCEMYVLINGHTLWRNRENEENARNLTQCEFRFAIIRHWYAMVRKTNGRMEVLHCPSYKPTKHRRLLSSAIMSPRKGSHELGRIAGDETSSEDGRLRCRVCKKKTSFKCLKCSSPGEPLSICSPQTKRDCWNEFHIQREYDVPSSQSQED